MRKADISLGEGKDLTDHLAGESKMPKDVVKNGKTDDVNVISGMQILKQEPWIIFYGMFLG